MPDILALQEQPHPTKIRAEGDDHRTGSRCFGDSFTDLHGHPRERGSDMVAVTHQTGSDMRAATAR